MIRIRTLDKNKPVIELPKNAAFVEICDNDENIACVVYFDKEQSCCNIFDSNSEQAEKYSKLFKTKFINKKFDIEDIKKEV